MCPQLQLTSSVGSESRQAPEFEASRGAITIVIQAPARRVEAICVAPRSVNHDPCPRDTRIRGMKCVVRQAGRSCIPVIAASFLFAAAASRALHDHRRVHGAGNPGRDAAFHSLTIPKRIDIATVVPLRAVAS